MKLDAALIASSMAGTACSATTPFVIAGVPASPLGSSQSSSFKAPKMASLSVALISSPVPEIEISSR